MEPDLDEFQDSCEETISLTCRDFVHERREEAEKFNSLLSHHLPSAVESWACDSEGWKFEYQHAVVAVYNHETGVISVHASSQTMPRKHLDGMRVQLRQLLQDMCEIDLTSTGFAVVLLQVCEEAAAWTQIWEKVLLQREIKTFSNHPGQVKRSLSQQHGWDAREIQSWESIMDNPFGVNLSTIEDTALHLLGKPISDICSCISEDFRILHVEPVFREDLAIRFLKRRGRMRKQLLNTPYRALRQSVASTCVRPGSREDTIEGLAEELSNPRVTFHGAPRRVIESIVRYGFIIPGSEIGNTGKSLDVAHGSSLGNGVYSSPDPMYASHYLNYQQSTHTTITRPSDVPGMRLLICATLMGRPMQRQWGQSLGTGGLLSDQAHSHVSPNHLEYVVYNSSQIIPVYVLHLDYGAEHARQEFDRMISDPHHFFERRRQKAKTVNKWEPGEETFPGDVQRKKQALKAAAAKWFPYGYGPAQGSNFVIEEIADVSDDEETYGDFQFQRIEREAEVREHVAERGASWFDEYQTVRKTNHDVV